MYPTHNKGKPIVAERFIRTLKNKIYRHMTAVSKNVYFEVLLKLNPFQVNKLQMNCINQLLENLECIKSILALNFYYASLMFSSNMHELFL